MISLEGSKAMKLVWLLTTDDEVVELPYEWLQLLLCQYVRTVPTLLQVIRGGGPNQLLGVQ